MCVCVRAFDVHVCAQTALPTQSKYHTDKYTSVAQTGIFSTRCGGAGVLPLFSRSAPSDATSFYLLFYFN